MSTLCLTLDFSSFAAHIAGEHKAPCCGQATFFEPANVQHRVDDGGVCRIEDDDRDRRRVGCSFRIIINRPVIEKRGAGEWSGVHLRPAATAVWGH